MELKKKQYPPLSFNRKIICPLLMSSSDCECNIFFRYQTLTSFPLLPPLCFQQQKQSHFTVASLCAIHTHSSLFIIRQSEKHIRCILKTCLIISTLIYSLSLTFNMWKLFLASYFSLVKWLYCVYFTFFNMNHCCCNNLIPPWVSVFHLILWGLKTLFFFKLLLLKCTRIILNAIEDGTCQNKTNMNNK